MLLLNCSNYRDVHKAHELVSDINCEEEFHK